MKTKTIPLIALGVILIAAVAVSFLISRPALFVKHESMPIFMGEEVTVKRGLEGIRGLQMLKKATEVKKAVKSERAIKASKVASQVVPQPKVATPLPILPPKISFRVLPEYPLTALEQGLGGTTILSIYVGLSGNPEDIEVKSSSGVSELDQSAVAAVSRWKFNPATQGGKAVASWFEIPVRFEVR